MAAQSQGLIHPVPTPTRHLRDHYQKRKYPRRYYVFGRVLQALWSEQSEQSEQHDGQSDAQSGAWTTDTYGQHIYTVPRRFVVVREGEWSCTVLPITTYRGQSMRKDGIRIHEHGIIYTGKTPPEPTDVPRHGPQMQQHPLKVDPDDRTERLDPLSRIDYAKQHNLDHKHRVRPIGKVSQHSLPYLLAQYETVNFRPSSPRLERAESVYYGGTSTAAPWQVPTDRSHSLLAAKAIRDLMAADWSHGDAMWIVRPPPEDVAEDIGAGEVTVALRAGHPRD
ncbi:hypothetical protein LTR53_001118 [Teratosphaeriaceae sp. CCFEE 6253]|nr:hypothetical protein LTR53_001118 [Teratosphaeriaceae sp. CCFEE 6253]